MASRSILPLPAGQQYRRFALTLQHTEIALLPPGHEFTLNLETGPFIVINWTNHHIATDDVFNAQELPLILALLDHWPSYVQNERLLQAITDRPPEEIAYVLYATCDTELEGLHQRVETCQARFHQIGIHIENIHQQGHKPSQHETPTAN
ncbi:hypothetical protein KSF_109010 [Reticulibacter mediterranei]|uniref:Uncharacterized protein n=1 Tax=Reticulibacter mediterranei TaxID=2778369 RepID=A0A8J3N9J3_9CHLR|nr:hypothetical protein [Reticulibacter mediterranei]GHP00854.1 hypothetical protein KSF_109010 [Reticulibacter mediterranei]